MSSAKGNVSKTRQPAHQNSWAFKHNTGSKKTARIARLPVHQMCLACTKVILWKKKYRKYKPRTQPGRCNLCKNKNVLAAYHVICRGCARKANVCAKCNVELNDENRPDEDEDGAAVLDEEDFREQQMAAARPGDRRGLHVPQGKAVSRGNSKKSKKKHKKKRSKEAKAAAVHKWRKGDAALLLNAGTRTPLVTGIIVAVYGARATVALDWLMADGKPATAFVGLDVLIQPGQAAPPLPAAADASASTNQGGDTSDSDGSNDDSDTSSEGRNGRPSAQGPKKNSFQDIIPKSRRKDLKFQQKHMQRARLPSNPRRT